MQALATHLRRKNLKILQQQLSLPKIPEKGPVQLPKTSARSRKPKSQLKYVSQTTMSPEEQHFQDQVRILLYKDSPKIRSEKDKLSDFSHPSFTKHEKYSLPRIKNVAQTPKKQIEMNKHLFDNQKIAKTRNNSGKLDLSSILKDQNGFIENYFAEISAKSKK